MPSQIPFIGSLHSVLRVRPFSQYLVPTYAIFILTDIHMYLIYIYGSMASTRLRSDLIYSFSHHHNTIACLSRVLWKLTEWLPLSSQWDLTVSNHHNMMRCCRSHYCSFVEWRSNHCFYLNLFRHTSIAFQMLKTTIHRRRIGLISICALFVDLNAVGKHNLTFLQPWLVYVLVIAVFALVSIERMVLSFFLRFCFVAVKLPKQPRPHLKRDTIYNKLYYRRFLVQATCVLVVDLLVVRMFKANCVHLQKQFKAITYAIIF